MIRLAQKKDIPEILAIYQYFVEKTAVTFDLRVPTSQALEAEMDRIMKEAPYLVCESEGRIIGYAYAAPYRAQEAYQWTRELKVYVDPFYHKQRVGTALYISLMDLLTLQKYRHLVAAIILPNIPSVAFHERLGFMLVGVLDNVGVKFGKAHRVGWFQHAIRDMYDPTEAIIPYQQIIDQSEGQKALKRGASRLLVGQK
jgi:phosphinothricin acetyltransferase